jgi:hypothetical protein
LNDSLEVPFIAMHVMEHAGFAYDGTVHDGRVDPIRLAALLGIGATWVQGVDVNTPTELALWPCFPNPFNSSTVIQYDLASPAFVELRLYNSLGQQVIALANERQQAGKHQIYWEGCDAAGLPVSSGVYLVQLQVGTEIRVQKVAVVR